jgi:hypothetical protein
VLATSTDLIDETTVQPDAERVLGRPAPHVRRLGTPPRRRLRFGAEITIYDPTSTPTAAVPLCRCAATLVEILGSGLRGLR